jgi:hypothetical protein
MTATLLDSRTRLSGESLSAAGAGDPRLALEAGGGRITLEERLQAAWRGLHTDRAAACPVCGSRMTLRDGAGECEGCEASLA